VLRTMLVSSNTMPRWVGLGVWFCPWLPF